MVFYYCQYKNKILVPKSTVNKGIFQYFVVSLTQNQVKQQSKKAALQELTDQYH
jgi:hypothetical protein